MVKIEIPTAGGTKTQRAGDLIAPAGLEVNSNHLKMGDKFAKTFFVFSYPRYLSTGWFSQIINLAELFDVSIFFQSADTGIALKQLQKKVTEVEAQIYERQEKGLVRDPALETAYRDIEALRDQLQQAREKLFEVSVYITIYGDDLNDLRRLENLITTLFEGKLIYIKPALFQQVEGFDSVLPLAQDKLAVRTPLNTSPASSLFPFISLDLTSDEGVMYGVNLGDNSLIIFDRFSLPNANMTIFATSGAGKSIKGDEPVLIKNKEGQTQLTAIGPLVENLIEHYGASKIDDELEGVIDPGLEVHSFDKDLKGEWSRVTVAARKRAPAVFYKFRTRSGREITTTGDHNMLVLKQGRVMAAKSSEIKEGEYVPLPRSVSQTGATTDYVNLLELLRGCRSVYVLGAKDLIEKHYPILKKALIDEKLDRYLYKYRQDRPLPLPYFLKIINYLGIAISSPEVQHIRLCAQNSARRASFRINFPVTDSFLKIAGYITAEGTIGDDFVMISNTDAEVLKDIDTSLKEMGVPFYYGNRGIVIASRVFVEIVKVLGGKAKSAEKTVWPLIFNTSKERMAKFISAYFEGDGGVEKHLISAVSKSQELISGISYLLYFFGIIGRVTRVKKKAQSMQNKQVYWRLTISGQTNLSKFADGINFVSQRKRQQLAAIIGNAEENTNVDLIPGISSIFQEIYELFGPQLYGIGEISDWKGNRRLPSPTRLKKVVSEIEERIRLFKEKGGIFEILNQLPNLEYLVSIGREKSLNRKLWQTLGQSWRLVKNNQIRPGFRNVSKIMAAAHLPVFPLSQVKYTIHSGFKEMDIAMKYYNRQIQQVLVDQAEDNTRYDTLERAGKFIWQNYQNFLNRIAKAEELLSQLKALANADLFWDPIVKIEKLENKKDKYVYDLTVNNEVFLAGLNGMFVHNSYASKLEILRSLMMGTNVIVIDPENEYQNLTQVVGGSYFKISLSSENHINPFEIPIIPEDEEPADVFKSHILNLTGLVKLMLGEIKPEEEALLDQAITETYASRDISPDKDFSQAAPPLLEDLQTILMNTEGGRGMAERLNRFTRGSYAGFTNKPTNVDIKNRLIVFSIRDLEEELRPIAMYVILNFIWNLIRAELKKRILVVDEAWWMMKYKDSASFMFGLVKRARKYYLGVTTITQDVADFMSSEYGRPIVTNSALQLLLRQSPATIDVVMKTFNLTEGEKTLLLGAGVGEGLFFAGLKHAAVRVIASYAEDQVITTNPEQILENQMPQL